MKKLGMIFVLAFLFFSCDNGNMDNESNKITITFVTNGGTKVAPLKIKPGEAFTLPTPEKEDADFEGWYVETELPEPFTVPVGWYVENGIALRGWYVDNKLLKPFTAETLSDDVTVYAKFVNHKKYRVIYYGNGHTSGEVPVDDNMYAEGDRFIPPEYSYVEPYIEKDGYVFYGWEVRGAVDIFPYQEIINGVGYADFPDSITFGKQDIECYVNWGLPQFLSN